MENDEAIDYPKWLEPFLDADFYNTYCKRHDRKYLTKYCRDCMGKAFCSICESHFQKHYRYQILEVHRASYWPSVEIDVIAKTLNIDLVQPFKINYKTVLLLRSKARKNRRHKTGATNCVVCKYKLIEDGYAFCSIKCQIIASRIRPSQDIALSNKEEEEEEEERKTSNSSSERHPTKNSQVSCSLRQRTRKGVPRRSPFF